MQMYLYSTARCIYAGQNCTSNNNGKKEFWWPEKFRSQRNDKDSLFRLRKRV
jgi:hypothetical protein